VTFLAQARPKIGRAKLLARVQGRSFVFVCSRYNAHPALQIRRSSAWLGCCTVAERQPHQCAASIPRGHIPLRDLASPFSTFLSASCCEGLVETSPVLAVYTLSFYCHTSMYHVPAAASQFQPTSAAYPYSRSPFVRLSRIQMQNFF
jgi:hypothetical protein